MDNPATHEKRLQRARSLFRDGDDFLLDLAIDDMIERLEERLGHPDRCPHGWPVDPSAERDENPKLKPLSEVGAGETVTIRRLAEHDGDLLHWFYDNDLVPQATAEVERVDAPAGMITLSVGGDQRAISIEAARGLFVQAA